MKKRETVETWRAARISKRYLIRNEGSDLASFEAALVLLQRTCSERQEADAATLFVPLSRVVRNSIMEEALGRKATSALLRRQEVELSEGTRLKLKTERTFECFCTRGVILAVSPTPRMLNMLDGVEAGSVVIVVPKTMDDVADWTRTWNPETPGAPRTPPEELNNSPLIEAALELITGRVNLCDSLGDPDDRGFAVDMLRALHECSQKLDPSSIRSWALRRGWPPKGARLLKGIAQAVVDGRRPRGIGYPPRVSSDFIKGLGVGLSMRRHLAGSQD